MVVVVAFQLQVMQVVTNLVPVFPVVSCENRTHVYIRSYVESSPESSPVQVLSLPARILPSTNISDYKRLWGGVY